MSGSFGYDEPTDDLEDEDDDERDGDGWSDGDFAEALHEALIAAADEDCGDAAEWSACSFSEAGLMTGNSGLVITTPQGEFQVTVVRSR